MLLLQDLEVLVKERLEDARILFDAKRYDGAYYLCGYVAEIGLKIRICRTLGWQGYPHTKNEFDGFASFKTHNLEVLSRLSGVEEKIKSQLIIEWSIIKLWVPEVRYSTQVQSHQNVEQMLNATSSLLKNL